MAIDPERTRYPGSRDPSWWKAYAHRWWRRWERTDKGERRPSRSLLWQRLRGMFNPHWVP